MPARGRHFNHVESKTICANVTLFFVVDKVEKVTMIMCDIISSLFVGGGEWVVRSGGEIVSPDKVSGRVFQ